MKKFLSFLLTFVMLFSLAMPAMAAEDDSLSTIYIDIGQLENAESVQSVWIHTMPGALVNNKPMTHVSGTIYSYDISAAVAGGENYVEFETFSDEGETKLGTCYTADFEAGKNLWIATGSESGTWSTYNPEGDTSGSTSGPTVNGGTSGDVSGSFDPGPIEFTGISFSSEFEHRYDAESNTYTVIIPADKIGGRVSYDVILNGTNLDLIDESNTLLMIAHDDIETGVVPNSLVVSLLRDLGHYDFGMSSAPDGHQHTDFYSNDGGNTWISVSSEVKQAYYVTVAESEHGTVAASAYALQGETVSLMVTPAEGYMLDKDNTTITDTEGNLVTLTENNTFEMPASAVTVSPVFKEAPVYYTVTLPETVENGSVTVDSKEYTVGQTVTLTVAPESGCKLSGLTVMNGETPVEVTPGENNTYTFAMPEGNVTVNATFEKITYAINIGTYEGGSVIVTVNGETVTNAAQGDTVTLTVATIGIYQLKSIVVKDASNNTVEFATTGEASGIYTFVMPASAVTVEAVIEEVRIVAADLVWGSLAYTYTDENGWQNQSSEANAGTVTVSNTGNVPFNAKATYSAEMDYMNIRGTFDHGATTLAAGENQSFKLTLNNRPNRVLNGQKIGTVTVHISETEFTDYVTVTNEQELLNAIADGSSIKFGNDITLSEELEVNSAAVIDLNGFTLDGIVLFVFENADISISGGTINLYPRNIGGKLTISNCTLNNDLNNMSGTTTLSNTTVNSGQLSVLGGTLICDFNPEGCLETRFSVATDNGDGTWTVTEK